MKKLYDVCVPRINVNDETVIIMLILIEEGQKVKKEQELCVISTSKQVHTITAPFKANIKKINMSVGEIKNIGDTIIILEK